MPEKKQTKKYPCSDCLQCQWCSDQKCSKCRLGCGKDTCKKGPDKDDGR